jgi:hypothetical protein
MCVAPGIALLAGSLFVACGSSSDSRSPTSRFLVTQEPIDVGVNPAGLCVAVDPTDPRGVWWWQPGPLDCSSRSTGPAVFHAEEAAVPLADGAVDIYFRIALIPLPEMSGPPFADIALRLEGGQMRADATGAQVSMGVRTDLDIPEAWR